MVNAKFQGPLPKGATRKETRRFRETGITVTKVKKAKKKAKARKRKGKSIIKGLILRPTKKSKRIPMVKKLTQQQVISSLKQNKIRTLQKILQSNASPNAKARARIMLENLN